MCKTSGFSRRAQVHGMKLIIIIVIGVGIVEQLQLTGHGLEGCNLISRWGNLLFLYITRSRRVRWPEPPIQSIQRALT
jgi:hypothetical protein